MQDTIVFLIRRLHEYNHKKYEKADKETREVKEMIKILMPNNYVTKLIGKSIFVEDNQMVR